MEPINVLAISGSLRAESYNSALLRVADHRAPESVRLEHYGGLRSLPPYDQDQDTDDPPAEVAELRHRVRSADGLLIATPEYNYGIPGALKNLIDWASRPAEDSCLRRKPVAIMGASPSPFGTVRAQLALRHCFLWTDSLVVAKPEVMVFDAPSRFDERLDLKDDTTGDLVGMLLGSLERMVRDARHAEALVGT
jgi:chromate reductase